MAKKQSEKKSVEKIEKSAQEEAPVQMCLIPEQNLRAVYNWLESDGMIMPYSQVKKCLELLGVAQVVVNKDI